MQFGRKKDWPHGKLILENIIENRKNTFFIRTFANAFNLRLRSHLSGKEIPEYKDEP